MREKRSQGLPITINELILVYRRHTHEYYQKNGKVTREAEIIDEVLRLVRKKHGGQRIEAFGPTALDELRDTMIDDLDWSRKYINRQTPRVIAMFKWAARKEICSAEVHAQLLTLGGLKKGRTRARETERVTIVEDDVVDQTLPHLPPIVADMVRLQRLTGARPGEICTLRPIDIDRSGSVWLYTPQEHKTEHHDKKRLIAIGPQAQSILLPYLVRHEDSYCFSPAESEEKRRRKAADKRKTPRSQGNSRGSNRVAAPKRTYSDFYSVASYRHAVQRACKKQEIKKWSPNQLRHSAATEIRKKFGLEAAQVVCGHQTADVTQIYAERDLDLAVRVAKEVG